MLDRSQHRRFGYQVMYLAVIALLVSGTQVIDLSKRSIAAERTPIVASEYDLKLARIYVTSKYIAWPDEAIKSTTPFVIGILDHDPFNGGLQKLTERKRLKDRPIRTMVIKTEQEYQPCHLLFIPRDTKPELIAAVLKRIVDQPVLVWRDEPDAEGALGVCCAFNREGESLLIEADPNELKRRKLVPDGQLLSLNLIRVVKTGK